MHKAAIKYGKVTFISFFTPDREVYVEDPVKFNAKNAEIAGMIKK